MKFKTDENMPVEAANDLRQPGHNRMMLPEEEL